MWQIRGDETHYQLKGPAGEESDLIPYGEPCELETEDGKYLAVVEQDGDDMISLLPDCWLLRLTHKVPDAQVEVMDVVFDDVAEGEDEEDGETDGLDDDDDGDEEEDGAEGESDSDGAGDGAEGEGDDDDDEGRD